MYRSNKEIIKVIKNENIIDVLCGKEPYEVECSRFTSDVFPTDINAVLVNYIYNIKLLLIICNHRKGNYPEKNWILNTEHPLGTN